MWEREGVEDRGCHPFSTGGNSWVWEREGLKTIAAISSQRKSSLKGNSLSKTGYRDTGSRPAV